jgi:hypothetical protein
MLGQKQFPFTYQHTMVITQGPRTSAVPTLEEANGSFCNPYLYLSVSGAPCPFPRHLLWSSAASQHGTCVLDLTRGGA